MVTFFASFAASGFDDGEEEIWLFKRGGFEAEKIRRPFSPKQNKSPARIDFYVLCNRPQVYFIVPKL
jgi:hypothetical protein